ncbi:MAG TPA: NAD(P)H-hydrate epimerase [Candidatus Saccharimonadales bacterium]|nr:NAD(P)H-hydrate epimerase [Candidatus Saccharimonadales bacterium]
MSVTALASAEQARGLDAAAVRAGVSVDSLMALAGFQCARLAQRLLASQGGDAGVAVLAGRGNNGSDSLGCARHLSAWGHKVQVVVLADVDDPESNYARQITAAMAAGARLRYHGEGLADALEWALTGAGLIIDGLLGTGSSGPPRGMTAEAIRAINLAPATVLAIDLPSGLDATSGDNAGGCVRADATVMLATAKSGCLADAARPVVGQLWLADIGVPKGAYRAAGLTAPDFQVGDLERFAST